MTQPWVGFYDKGRNVNKLEISHSSKGEVAQLIERAETLIYDWSK